MTEWVNGWLIDWIAVLIILLLGSIIQFFASFSKGIVQSFGSVNSTSYNHSSLSVQPTK